MPVEKVSIKEKLDLFTDYWNPRIVGELNGQFIKLAKLKGEFIWHKHELEDELFLVISGNLTMELRDKIILLKEGDFLIVPRGTEHRPVAPEEVQLMLFEPVGTLNTGNLVNERTKAELERL
jgi:mannose-6-phosphate isomerase-like protein (cupin superfamily)